MDERSQSIDPGLYRKVWRWHFFAGIFVVPFVIVLAVTGTIYLFANDIEKAIDARISERAVSGVEISYLSADTIVENALDTVDDGKLVRFIVPQADARIVQVVIFVEGEEHLVWLDRVTGSVLHSVAMKDRFLSVVQRIHSSLLAGWIGNRLVELVASFAIILVVSGVWMYWPRGRAVSSLFLIDFSLKGRALWKPLHGAAGLLSSVFILAFLMSGLLWTGVWGEGFAKVRQYAGWTGPGQEWVVTLESAGEHDHGDGLALWTTDGAEGDVAVFSTKTPFSEDKGIALDSVVARISNETLAPPVWVQPPQTDVGVWTVRAMSPTRHLRETVHFDRWSGQEIMRIRFSDYHIVEQVMGHGLSFHEGALFGPLNKVIGVLTALFILILSATGLVLWIKRRPNGHVGAPRSLSHYRLPNFMKVAYLGLLLFLPVAGLVILTLWMFEVCTGQFRRAYLDRQ